MRAKRTANMDREGFSKLLQNVRKKVGHNILGLTFISSAVVDELLSNWDFYEKFIKINQEKGGDDNA